MIINSTNDTVITGTSNADFITNSASKVTINALGGNDTISISSDSYDNVIEYASGDGNDIIYGLNTNILNIKSGNLDKVEIISDDLILTIDNDTIKLKDKAQENFYYKLGSGALNIQCGTSNFSNVYNTISGAVNIIGSDGHDQISNAGFFATINGGAGNDRIDNYCADNVSINGGSGLDYIINCGSKNILIYGNADDDYISSYGSEESGSSENVTIDGGNGDDYIGVQGANYIVRGGKGNDTVNVTEWDERWKNVEYIFEYSEGDGNDFVTRDAVIFLKDDLKADEVLISDKDIVLKIGDGSIKIFDAVDSNGEVYFTTITSNDYSEYFGYDEITNDQSGQVITFENRIHRKFKITNTADNSTIQGNSAGDSVINSGNNVSIDTGQGNNHILNFGDYDMIITHSGFDTINNTGKNTTIEAKGGDNQISNESGADNNLIITGDGSDSISNGVWCYPGGDDVTVISSAGEDSIINSGANCAVYSGADNDSIDNSGTNTFVDSGDGDDEIDNTYEGNIYSTVCGGNGNDTIHNMIANKVTVDGGAGDDSIGNNGSQILINGGEGNDNIESSYSKAVTVSGGAGDDTIHSTSDYSYISSDEGNDSVYNNGTNTKIDAADGNDYIYTCPSSYKNVVNGGSGNDTIDANGTHSLVNGEQGDDVISNSAKGSELNGDDGNDKIYNGDQYDEGEEIESQREKAINEAEKLAEELSEEIRKQIEDEDNPVIKDILEKGANSKYLQYLPENEKNTLSEMFNKIKEIISAESNWISTINDIDEKVYELYAQTRRLLVKDLTEVMDSKYADEIIRKNYPAIAKIQDAEKEAIKKSLKNLDNNMSKFGNLWKNVGKYGKLAKELPILGQCVSAFEFGGALGAGIMDLAQGNANTDTVDRIVIASIDFGTSILPTKTLKKLKFIPGGDSGDILAGEGLKAAYKNYAKERDKRALLKEFTKSDSSSSELLFVADIEINSDTVIMNGGADNDALLNNKFDLVMINGDDGDDNIKNYNTREVTITGGNGRDLITNLNSAEVQIDGGNGDDTIISNYSANVDIESGAGDDYLTVYDNSDIKISTGEGNDTVENYGKYTLIQTGNGADSILNIGANVSISAGNEDDEIESSGDEVTVSAGEGDNSINIEGEKIILTTGDGANSINAEEFNYGVIQTGNGEDEILTFGNNNKISAGNGDNGIINVGDSNILLTGDDKDCIENIGNSNVIESGAGDDLIFMVNSTSNTILGGTGDDVIYIDDGKENLIRYSSGNDTIFGYEDNSNVIEVIDGEINTVVSGDDLIIKVGTDSLTLKDSANKSVNIKGTFIINDNKIPDGFSLKNGVLTVTKNFTGETIDLTEDWATDVKKTNATAFSKPLSIIGKDTANSIKGGKAADTISGGAGKDTIYGGSGNDLISGGEGNDLLKGDAGIDTIDGGEGTNTLTGGAGKDVFVHSEGEDVITDYAAGQDKIMVNSVTGDSLKGSDIILFTDNGNVTVKGGKNKKITVVDSEDNTTTKVYGQYNYSKSNTKLALTSGFSGTLNSDDYDSAVEEINASAITKSGRIYGNDNNNVIIGSARNDSINGNGENNTLTGGNGNDVFIHAKGNDFITDYTVGKDKIKLLNVTITSAELDENDLILKTSNGTITVAEGKGKKITVVDSKNRTTTSEYPLFLEGLTYDTKNVVLTATENFTGETIDLTDYYSTVTKVNANVVKHAIEIYGNDRNNSIKGGKGSDTIYGGVSNDTLTGGTGKDVFVYEKGDDVITDYKAGQDKIKFEGVSITGSTIKSSNVILQTDEGTLTIKSGRNKNITVIDSSGNETTQVYGNTSALLEDNLFVEDVTIDEITEIETGVNLKFTEEKLYEQPELVIVKTDENNFLK